MMKGNEVLIIVIDKYHRIIYYGGVEMILNTGFGIDDMPWREISDKMQLASFPKCQ